MTAAHGPEPAAADAMRTAAHPVALRRTGGIRRIAAAFGVFDGVHLGHRRILDRVTALAAETGATPTVITFDTHPRTVLSADRPPRLLTTIPQRLRLLEGAGVAAAVLLPFGPAMASMEAEAFLRAYVFCPGGPEVAALCVGASWRFGRGAAGDVATLQAAAAAFGCRVESVPEVLLGGRPISSTRVREAVLAGRLEEAAALLGRPFAVAGTVKHGKGIGGDALGCPTANLDQEDLVLPPDGVYAARARRGGRDPALPGIAYVGTSPTFRTEGETMAPRRVELHLFDWTGRLYGEEIEVEFAAWLREDRRFASPDALRAQILRDLAAARQTLGLPGAGAG